MTDKFEKLKNIALTFSNHHRKYIHHIIQHKDELLERLEMEGKLDSVHLWRPAPNIINDMEIIQGLGNDEKEKINFLGCYLSLQYLKMNERALDVLKTGYSFGISRKDSHVYFIEQAGKNFQRLFSSFLSCLMNICAPPEGLPEYVICSVGTRSDQDDIDVGIVDNGDPARKILNQVLGKVSTLMMRYATNLHFHLSEHIGSESYSANIQEFLDVLEKELSDFVIISEMLGARPIVGNHELFNEFWNKVIKRYYYKEGSFSKFHEGYVRGIVGEVIHLTNEKIDTDRLIPKENALRIIKGLISVKKVIFGVTNTSNWEIINRLKEVDILRKKEYEVLEEALSFFEIFRYLYQLLVVQEEEIILKGDYIQENLKKVANYMGYEDKGLLSASSHFLVDYFDNIEKIRAITKILVDDLKNHLSQTTVLLPLLLPEKNYEGLNTADTFLQCMKFFRGATFWLDILEALADKNSGFLERLVKDFIFPTGELNRELIIEYVKYMSYDLYYMLEFLYLIGEEKKDTTQRKFFTEMNMVFLDNLPALQNPVLELTRVFYRNPALIYNYLSRLDERSLKKLSAFLQRTVWEEKLTTYHKKFLKLIQVISWSSPYLRRYMDRIFKKYPECITNIDEPLWLEEKARGLFGVIENIQSFEKKKDYLGDYYDLELLRTGFGSFNGASLEDSSRIYTEFSDNYIQTLFEICREEIEQETGQSVITHDMLAIYASGGHAREQAYDEDYDMIVLLDSEEEEIRQFCSKIIARISRDVSKRGILPHHKFVDCFGEYVVLLKELEDFFSLNEPTDYIEKSQLLGCRMLVGSQRFEQRFHNRIIKKYIFDEKEKYIKSMIQEIRSRHSITEDEMCYNDVKECPGGLRDIEMILLIFKAMYEIREPITQKFFQIPARKVPKYAREFYLLNDSLYFLKNLRDLYKITAGSTDLLDVNHLVIPAQILGIKDSAAWSGADEVMSTFISATSHTQRIINNLLNNLD